MNYDNEESNRLKLYLNGAVNPIRKYEYYNLTQDYKAWSM